MPSQASSSTPSEQHTFFAPTHQETNGSGNGTDGTAEGFNVLTWYPSYQSCQRFFINHAQHSGLVQGVAAFVNIRLPFQFTSSPISSLTTSSSIPSSPSPISPFYQNASQYGFPGHSRSTSIAPSAPSMPFVSLVPYIRRLIVTGFDTDGIMHGFFGNDWQKGVGPLHEIERRNYLFAAKSVGWGRVKNQYDMSPDETVPFMQPLSRVQLAELEKSDDSWHDWMMMEDWVIGPRAPDQTVRRATAGAPDGHHHRDRDEMMPDGHH